MNVKFVGRIIMTVLFVFICIGAHAGDDPLKYEIEGEGVGAQGIYLVKVADAKGNVATYKLSVK